ncbi:MAG: serine/threonine-protein kinase [Cyanobacteria bacterium P01_F01_bin.150]
MVSSSSSNRKSKLKAKAKAKGKRAPFARKRTLVGGRYSVLKRLSEGAFGHTLLAEDTHLPGNPKCVLKQLKPQVGNRAMQTSRRLFEQEAQVLYELGNHPQIPQLLAHFEDKEGFYLAQEYIEGRSLSREIRATVPYAESQVIQLIREILEVLVFVHQQQVIHRDLKPSNLIRRKQDGKIVMIDFGAVKQVGSQFLNPAPGETDYTIAIGTVGYIPNEQLGGRPRYSSDIYAVGMIALQALTGLAPTEFDDDDRTGEILWRDRVSNISPAFATVLRRMVAYDFRERYTTATEALDIFQQMETGNLLTAKPLSEQSLIPLPVTPHPPTTISLPPTEHHGIDCELAPHSEPNLIPTGLNWVQSAPSKAQDYSITPSSIINQITRFQHQLQDQCMALAVNLWRQQHRINPWYLFAIATMAGSVSVAQKGSWIFAQQNTFLFANSVSPPTVLEPAERLVKNLPAIDTFESVQTQVLEDMQSYLKEAKIAVEEEDYQKAVGFYGKVLELDNQNLEALTQRCSLLSQLERPLKARSACEELEGVSPNDVIALSGLGNANRDMGQYQLALEYYEKALGLAPDYRPAQIGKNEVVQLLNETNQES